MEKNIDTNNINRNHINSNKSDSNTNIRCNHTDDEDEAMLSIINNSNRSHYITQSMTSMTSTETSQPSLTMSQQIEKF